MLQLLATSGGYIYSVAAPSNMEKVHFLIPAPGNVGWGPHLGSIWQGNGGSYFLNSQFLKQEELCGEGWMEGGHTLEGFNT